MFYLVAAVALVAAFGRDATATPGGEGGVKVFDDAPTVGFCSFVKVGRQFLDAETGRELTRAEAEARAQRENCGKGLL